MSIPKMHGETNKEVTPDERVFLASVIKMSKVLAQERRQHSLYQQPLRLYVSADVFKYGFSFVAGDATQEVKALSDFQVLCQFIQQLDPLHTQMGIEIVPGRYAIQYNNVRSVRNAIGNEAINYYKFNPVNIEIKTTNSPHYFNTKTKSYFARLPFVQLGSSSSVGLPLSDVNFLNNQNLTFRATSGEYKQNDPDSPKPVFFQIDDIPLTPIAYNSFLTFTLVFWKNTISEE